MVRFEYEISESSDCIVNYNEAYEDHLEENDLIDVRLQIISKFNFSRSNNRLKSRGKPGSAWISSSRRNLQLEGKEEMVASRA